MGLTKFINKGGFTVPVFHGFILPSSDPVLLGVSTLNLYNTLGSVGSVNWAGKANLNNTFNLSPNLTVSGSDLPAEPNNMSILRDLGHPIPPVSHWWKTEPSAEDIKDMLVPMHDSGNLCSRRLLMPAVLTSGVTIDNGWMHNLINAPTGPQSHAVVSHYRRDKGEDTLANESMALAISGALAEPYTGNIGSGGDIEELWSRILSLDWIEWENSIQYETLFESTRQFMEIEISGKISGGRIWYEDGYFDPNHAADTFWYFRSLLAFTAYGVNPTGYSHTWADEQIGLIKGPWDHDPITGASGTTDANFSPWQLANALNIVSRRGGGTDYGWGNTGFHAIGGYDSYYFGGGSLYLGACSTALNENFVTDNLYFQTRYLAELAEMEPETNLTNQSSAADIKNVSKMFNNVGSGEIAGHYAWLFDTYTAAGARIDDIQAVLGPMPDIVQPTGIFTGILGSHFVHKNFADPRNSFRFMHTCKAFDSFRFPSEERTFSFGKGDVKLVEARTDRGPRAGGHSNGFWFGIYDSVNGLDVSGWPSIIATDKFARRMTHSRYQDGYEARTVNQAMFWTRYFVSGDIVFPQLNSSGNWEMFWDTTNRLGYFSGGGVAVGRGITGPCNHQMIFDSGNERVTFIDNLSIATGIYLGWHFATSHVPTTSGNGFDITDGTYTIRVHIESLDPGVSFTELSRAQWIIGGAPVSFDWNGRSVPVRNVSYVPTPRTATNSIKTTIEVL